MHPVFLPRQFAHVAAVPCLPLCRGIAASVTNIAGSSVCKCRTGARLSLHPSHLTLSTCLSSSQAAASKRPASRVSHVVDTNMPGAKRRRKRYGRAQPRYASHYGCEPAARGLPNMHPCPSRTAP
jgi:hypothetical protein